MGRPFVVAGLLATLSCASPALTQDAKSPPSTPAENPDEVRVHLDAPPGAGLEVMPEKLQVCEAPCEAVLSKRYRYRVAGGGLHASEPFFLLRNDQGPSVVAVRSSVPFFLSGVAALVGGVAATNVGFAFLILPDDAPQTAQRTEGAVLLTLGVAAILAGAVLMRDNRGTSIKGDVLTGLLSGQRSAHIYPWSGPADRTPVPPVHTVPFYALAF